MIGRAEERMGKRSELPNPKTWDIVLLLILPINFINFFIVIRVL